MTKLIRIFAILSIVLDFIYILVGKLIAPILTIYFNKNLTYMGMSAMTQRAITFYYVTTVLGGVFALIYLIFAIVTIIIAGSKKTRIGFEVAAFIVLGVVVPFLHVTSSLIVTYISNLTYHYTMVANYIISLMNSSTHSFIAIHVAAIGLLFAALGISICKKKYVPEDEFIKE